MTRRLALRRLRICVPLVAIVAVARIGGASSIDPERGPASDSLVRAWSERVRSSTTIQVVRHFHWRAPARFKSARPSGYLENRKVERTLEGESADQVRRALGLEDRLPSPDECERFTCSGDPRDGSTTRLRFVDPRNTVQLEILFARGGARITDQNSLSWACLRFPDGGRQLKALLVRALPDDSILARARLCTDTTVTAAEDDRAWGELVDVETLPEAVTKVPPDYPKSARKAGRDGTAMIQALVARDGTVRQTLVVKPLSRDLDAAAVRAVEQWRFRPATAHGKPVAVWVAIPIRFTLR